jgi:hypothetical protein
MTLGKSLVDIDRYGVKDHISGIGCGDNQMKLDTIKWFWEVIDRAFHPPAITPRHIVNISLTYKTEFLIIQL